MPDRHPWRRLAALTRLASEVLRSRSQLPSRSFSFPADRRLERHALRKGRALARHVWHPPSPPVWARERIRASLAAS